MKTLLTFFVLLLVGFSTSAYAETFNCMVEQPNEKFGKTPYSLFIDITDEKGLITFTDPESLQVEKIISDFPYYVGTLYFQKPHPYGLSDIKTEAFFWSGQVEASKENPDLPISGFFFMDFPKPLQIVITRKTKTVIISDNDSHFGGISNGKCK